MDFAQVDNVQVDTTALTNSAVNRSEDWPVLDSVNPIYSNLFRLILIEILTEKHLELIHLNVI